MISVRQLDEASAVITAGSGRARLSSYTSTRTGCVHWRVAELLARRSPRELQIVEDGGSRWITRRYAPQARGNRPDRVIDMTSGPLWVQIATPGGIIDIHTGLVTSTGDPLPVVLTEITPSTRYKPTSGDGGHWEAKARDFLVDRTDVTLTREGDI